MTNQCYHFKLFYNQQKISVVTTLSNQGTEMKPRKAQNNPDWWQTATNIRGIK